jgi:RNA polymerase sigma factor (sigma-70 family)
MTPLSDDEAARVGALFEAHRPFVESIARNHAPSRDDVPDVVQNVGVRMCQSLRGFRGEASITTWLYSVTVSTAIDLFRKERSHLYRPREALGRLPVSDVCASFGLDPEADLQRRERGVALREAIGRLSAPAQVKAMRDDLRADDVSCSSKDIRWRARQRLRDLLDGDPRIA